jgi:hypothetical protein
MNKNNKTKTIENYRTCDNNETIYASAIEATPRCEEQDPVKIARKCTNENGDIRWQCRIPRNTPSSSPPSSS